MRTLAPAALICLALGCDDGSDSQPTDTGLTDATTTDTGGADATAPSGPTPEALADRVELAAFSADLEFIARPRTPGSPHWQAVQDRCAEVFTEAGFTVERHTYRSGVNVIGVRPGTTRPQEWVVISGHYDHIEACSGADDNASGTAGVLAAARALAGTSFERTVVVACWDEEELGLVGSGFWVRRTTRQGFEVKASYVLESMGYFSDEPGSQTLPFGFEQLFEEAGRLITERAFRGDFIAAIADDLDPSPLADCVAGAERVDLPVVPVVLNGPFRSDPSLGDLRRSDHAQFWQADLPAMMLTCTANFRNSAYHCGEGDDDITDVDVERTLKVVQATTFAAARQATPTLGEPGPLDTTTDPVPPPPPCDPVAQACPDGQKCTVQDVEGVYEAICVPAGATALGEVCTRGPRGLGDDTCVEGGYCAFFGQPFADPQVRACHALCQDPDDCPEGESCVQVERALQIGVCTPRCDLADPAACGEGQLCTERATARPGPTTTACQPSPPE